MPEPSGQLDSSLLSEVFSKDPRLATVLQTIIDGVNTTARNAGVSATGQITAPKPPDQVNVKVVGEMAHVSISHTGPIDRGMHYFTEVAPNDPAFGSPVVYHHGTSRTPPPITLPTFLDGGGNKVDYHIRSYAQHPGGSPSAPTVAVGGPFQMGGTTQMTLLPSRGSGTAPNNGQSSGQGFGRNQRRES